MAALWGRGSITTIQRVCVCVCVVPGRALHTPEMGPTGLCCSCVHQPPLLQLGEEPEPLSAARSSLGQKNASKGQWRSLQVTDVQETGVTRNGWGLEQIFFLPLAVGPAGI